MNFKIKEQSSTKIYQEKYETCKDLYLYSKLTIKEIINKLGLSQKQVSVMVDEIEKETGYRRISYGGVSKLIKVPETPVVDVTTDFMDDYINHLEMTQDDLKKKYGLSEWDYDKLVLDVQKKTGYTRSAGAHRILLPIEDMVEL